MNNRKEDIGQLCKQAAADVIRSDPQAFVSHFFKGATVERPLTAAEKYIGEIQAEEQTMSWLEEWEKAWVMSWIEGEVYRAHKSILKILRVHCPDLFDKIVELPKRLERIQNIEALEKIEDAGLASDSQNAQTLIETNAPLE